jgi:hypothetical protein
VNYYARLFGYGETAGLDIPGEKPGFFPSAPPKNGGVGMLTSFGEEISQTPLQLAALMSALSNGGTLYYLQYPRTQQDIDGFVPRVKRQLEIQDLIREVKPGMQGAVEYGTARRARQEETIMGKTGTCSEGRTHLGWFGSFNDVGPNKLVVVVLLTGGRPSIGPMAAGVAGDVYRHLAEQNFFAANHHAILRRSGVDANLLLALKPPRPHFEICGIGERGLRFDFGDGPTATAGPATAGPRSLGFPQPAPLGNRMFQRFQAQSRNTEISR